MIFSGIELNTEDVVDLGDNKVPSKQKVMFEGKQYLIDIPDKCRFTRVCVIDGVLKLVPIEQNILVGA